MGYGPRKRGSSPGERGSGPGEMGSGPGEGIQIPSEESQTVLETPRFEELRDGRLTKSGVSFKVNFFFFKNVLFGFVKGL